MKKGSLSEYFYGIAAKRLSIVEINKNISNQHEFNGDRELRRILGDCGEPIKYDATFFYFSDNLDDPVIRPGELTWYDARRLARARGVRRAAECRLYYTDNEAINLAAGGDTMFVGRRQAGDPFVIVAHGGSIVEQQLQWLSDVAPQENGGFAVVTEDMADQIHINLVGRQILESLRIDVVEEEPDELNLMIERFGLQFPSTAIFSAFARERAPEVSALDDPDDALYQWFDTEDRLFRVFERHGLTQTVTQGFDGDVDRFVQYALSVLNRRKSRAGKSLENHVEALFADCGLRYTREPKTEGNCKPDFILPSISYYQDFDFPSVDLTMLGVKTSCKDRWRQVLTEAARIERKHLLTFESGISVQQTHEMRGLNLQLVVPQQIHPSFQQKQRDWLWNMDDFVTFAKEIQERTDDRI